jgi:chloramphenicol 3-O phosphotransferase
MTGPATIVLLNGVGSSGKSSIARALQSMAARPFLHVQLDAFIDMMPAASRGSPDGLVFIPLEMDGHPAMRVHSGETAKAVFRGMRRAIAALADAGNDLIVDDVNWGEELADYRALLSDHDFRTVGVFASLESLEACERGRAVRSRPLGECL